MEKSEGYGNAGVRLLSLAQIAAWQVKNESVRGGDIIAALPALQRGYVWKARQVEDLWDSIVSGFPIGAFLITPFNEVNGAQGAMHQGDGVPDPTHHLLDGQQRATGIALGFLNPRGIDESIRGALWLDVGEQPPGRAVQHVFRVLTRAHPWGYRRTDPAQTLSISQIRQAIRAYKETSPIYRDARPYSIPLSATWPWDAEAPIPVALIVSCVMGSSSVEAAKASLGCQMRELPFFSESTSDHHNAQKAKSGLALSGEGPHGARLARIIERFWGILKGERPYEVATVEIAFDYEVAPQGQKDAKDPIETLFVRLNSGGTVLEGEELIYSLLKARWTEAPAFIDKLRHRLATPSRICLLCARLVLARGQTDPSGLQASPGVPEFRRLMHGVTRGQENFANDLQKFVTEDGVRVFECAHRLLVANDGEEGNAAYALPAVLATDLAQKAPDVFFLLLCWIDRALTCGSDPLALADGDQRKILGFLTALAWFAHDKSGAVSAIWGDLQRAPADEILSFFSRPRFRKTWALGRNGTRRMGPLVSPALLEQVLQLRVTGGAANFPGIGNRDSSIWENGNEGWNRWDRLVWSMPHALKEWYKGRVGTMWQAQGEAEEDGILGLYQQAWGEFIDDLWSNRSILLYAQRRWTRAWFPEFDPSQPEMLEDTNRPWDFDHIHPQNYLRNDDGNGFKNIPNVVRDWHKSIGNLRAWPLEANRSDGDRSPARKLSEGTPIDGEYGMVDQDARMRASIIHRDDCQRWIETTPEGDFVAQYLADAEGSFVQRRALIEAIVTRFTRLYGEWYRTLRIGDLMP